MQKTVLITGTSSGFGLLITQTLLSKGYTVFATMRQLTGKNARIAQEIKSLADDTPGKLHLLELDVVHDQSVAQAIAQALALESQIDILINNAGLGVGGFTEGFSTEQFQKLFDVNVFGVHRLMRAVLPEMRQRNKGLIINISSVMGRIVLPFAGPYTATKFALEGLTESYRYELASSGVDVVIVEPGGFMTGFGERMMYPQDEERVKSYGAMAEVPDQMWTNVLHTLSQVKDQIDPQLVADAVANLIETPDGERPFRTVVDPMSGGEGPKTINQTQEQIQKQLIEGMQMTDLVKLKV